MNELIFIIIGTTTTALMGIGSFIAWQVWEMKMLLTRTTMRLDSHEQRISQLEQHGEAHASIRRRQETH